MSGFLTPVFGGPAFGLGGQTAQTAIPIADISQGKWSNQFSAGLFSALNTDTPDSSIYVVSAEEVGTDTFEVLMSTVVDPAVDFDHVLSYQFRKEGNMQADLTVALIQGVTVIASYSHLDISSSFTLQEQVLSAAEAAAITNYADLRIRFTETIT